MPIFIALFLAAALGVTLIKLRNHQHAIRSLHQSLLKKQPLLREDLPSLSGAAWDRLCALSNDLITEVDHLQQLRNNQLAQLEATLGSLQEAVLIVDSNNYIILGNKALRDMFPRAVNILGQRLELVLHSVAFLNYVEAVRRGTGQPQHEIEFIDGPLSIWVEATGVTIQTLNSQKAPWTLFVLHNITKQKKLESVRKDFVANVSHELRTPLSVIKGYVETLVDGVGEIPAEDRLRFLKTIQRHTERLNSLLEDLLVLSRLESIDPGVRREPIALNTLFSDIIDDYRARPAGKGHTLEFVAEQIMPPVPVDPSKITQVIENLIDNALKYTPQNSTVTLSATLHDPQQEVVVCLRDNGPGIPREDLPHIFERFYRVDKGRSREKGGTGLGLSIVKHIIQLHAGRVWAESQQEQGTAIFFTLPIHPA